MDKNVFPKGTYVVLLSSCLGGDTWSTLPINHIYKLREDSQSNWFRVEKSMKGRSDGWTTSSLSPGCNKLELREATPHEIVMYETGIRKTTPEPNYGPHSSHYQIY